jgi:hypothetical protein
MSELRGTMASVWFGASDLIFKYSADERGEFGTGELRSIFLYLIENGFGWASV